MEKEAELGSRKKRNVAYPVPSHLSPASRIYPKTVTKTYYPTKVIYQPKMKLSEIYRPSDVKVTKTTVKLSHELVNAEEETGEEAVIPVEGEVVVGTGEETMESGATKEESLDEDADETMT